MLFILEGEDYLLWCKERMDFLLIVTGVTCSGHILHIYEMRRNYAIACAITLHLKLYHCIITHGKFNLYRFSRMDVIKANINNATKIITTMLDGTVIYL